MGNHDARPAEVFFEPLEQSRHVAGVHADRVARRERREVPVLYQAEIVHPAPRDLHVPLVAAVEVGPHRAAEKMRAAEAHGLVAKETDVGMAGFEPPRKRFLFLFHGSLSVVFMVARDENRGFFPAGNKPVERSVVAKRDNVSGQYQDVRVGVPRQAEGGTELQMKVAVDQKFHDAAPAGTLHQEARSKVSLLFSTSASTSFTRSSSPSSNHFLLFLPLPL